jgi:hypothetical protein
VRVLHWAYHPEIRMNNPLGVSALPNAYPTHAWRIPETGTDPKYPWRDRISALSAHFLAISRDPRPPPRESAVTPFRSKASFAE